MEAEATLFPFPPFFKFRSQKSKLVQFLLPLWICTGTNRGAGTASSVCNSTYYDSFLIVQSRSRTVSSSSILNSELSTVERRGFGFAAIPSGTPDHFLGKFFFFHRERAQIKLPSILLTNYFINFCFSRNIFITISITSHYARKVDLKIRKKTQVAWKYKILRTI